MFAHGIEIKPRPHNGTRAFTESEDRLIYEVLESGKESTLTLAAALGVWPNTILAARRRHLKRLRKRNQEEAA